RGAGANFDILRLPKLQIAIFDIPTRTIMVLPDQAGLNLNPQWSPDGKSIAYVSDRGGVANVYLYDFDTRSHYQLTNVVGGVIGITEYSPAISWARGADRLAITLFENSQYTVHTINNPRGLKRIPLAAPVVAALPSRGATIAPEDSARTATVAAAGSSFLYRTANGEIRASSNLPLVGDTLEPVVSIA